MNNYTLYTTHNIRNFFYTLRKEHTSPISTLRAAQIRFNISSRAESFLYRQQLHDFLWPAYLLQNGCCIAVKCCVVNQSE